MSLSDPPWTNDEGWRTLYRLASFAKDTSGADGVICVFVKGELAQLSWHLPPSLYPSIPKILSSASADSVTQLQQALSDPGVRLPDEVREQLELLIRLYAQQAN